MPSNDDSLSRSSDGQRQPGSPAGSHARTEPRVPEFLIDPAAEFFDDLRAGHLSYEMIEAYVERRLGQQTCSEVEAHVHSCPECAGDVQELSAFAARATRSPETAAKVSWFHRFSEFLRVPTVRWAAAAVCVLTIAGVSLQRLHQPGAGLEQAMPGDSAAPVPPRMEAIQDGPTRVEIRTGRVVDGQAYEERYAPLVGRALTDPDWRPGAASSTSATRSEEVARLRQTHPQSHLLLGVVEAKYGMIAAAREDFFALQATNPNSATIARLLRAVEAEKVAAPR